MNMQEMVKDLRDVNSCWRCSSKVMHLSDYQLCGVYPCRLCISCYCKWKEVEVNKSLFEECSDEMLRFDVFKVNKDIDAAMKSRKIILALERAIFELAKTWAPDPMVVPKISEMKG